MTDSDERLSRRYRELAREEPPPLLDQAILASARRAVAPPARHRWAIPVSIAAVLMLGIGVSLRMQTESPGIETSVPERSAPSAPNEYSVPQAADEPAPVEKAKEPAREEKPAAITAPLRKRVEPAPEQPAPLARRDAQPFPERGAVNKVEEPPVLAAQAPVPAAPPAVMPVPAAAEPAAAPPAARIAAPQSPPPRSATTIAATTATPTPQTLPRKTAERAASAPMQESRAKERSEAAASAADSTVAPKDAREVELDRIARLRTEGRHAEADKALEEFRRLNPGYRIPEAVWERVKPR